MKRALLLVVAACGSFEDPNVVVDLRVLAMAAAPPDQVIDVDLTQPISPVALLAQLVPTQVCALIADPSLDRRLVWSMQACVFGTGDRCDDGYPPIELGGGVLEDPDRTVPEPQLCATVTPDASLLGLLYQILQNDALHGLGGIDYAVVLRVGGQDADRALDQYAAKTVRVAPHIPMARTANTNPTIDHVDASIDDGPAVALPLGRCPENAAPYVLAPGTKLRLTPAEPPGAREVYAVPTLDGQVQTFTESLTYQWVAGAGGFSRGNTGGPRDLSGNPAPLFSDYKSPAAADLMGPMDVALWIIQRDERLGVRWYESCVRVTP